MYTFTLPIQIGTKVFAPCVHRRCTQDGEWYIEAEIREEEVSMLQQKKDGTWKFRINGFTDCTLDVIGKGVFLNREDAEDNLKQRVKNLQDVVVRAVSK